MRLTKESKDGFEWAIKEIQKMKGKNISPEKRLAKVGIKSIEDCFFFFEYLIETDRKWLVDELGK